MIAIRICYEDKQNLKHYEVKFKKSLYYQKNILDVIFKEEIWKERILKIHQQNKALYDQIF